MSPTSRTLQWCRDRGWVAIKVEHWNPFAGIRQDLWGFDILALAEDRLFGIQVTTVDHMSDRQKKIDSLPQTPLWLRAKAGILVMGWAKHGPRGKRKTWSPVIRTRGYTTWMEWSPTPSPSTPVTCLSPSLTQA